MSKNYRAHTLTHTQGGIHIKNEHELFRHTSGSNYCRNDEISSKDIEFSRPPFGNIKAGNFK